MLETLATILEGLCEKHQAREPLTDEEDDLEWAGAIGIGTVSQNFLIDLDGQ